jgi:hypothetical protein
MGELGTDFTQEWKQMRVDAFYAPPNYILSQKEKKNIYAKCL